MHWVQILLRNLKLWKIKWILKELPSIMNMQKDFTLGILLFSYSLKFHWDNIWDYFKASWRKQMKWSHTFPSCKTRIRSHWMTVFNRWAMVNMVQSLKTSRNVFCTMTSVWLSMAAVASSRRRICQVSNNSLPWFHHICINNGFIKKFNVALLCRRSALAMHKSCLSPTEKFSPFSVTIVSSCSASIFTLSFILVRSRASQMATSVYFSKGSKLYLFKSYMAKLIHQFQSTLFLLFI